MDVDRSLYNIHGGGARHPRARASPSLSL